jgi:hypothetical protein
MKKLGLFLVLSLLLLSLTSATTFGYNYLDNKVTGTNGTTNNYNITNVTVNATVNTTQFDSNDPITIKESWLESFIESISKWANYWTKTENIDQTDYNITADYFFGDGSQLTNLPDGGNSSWNESLADALYYPLNLNPNNYTTNESASTYINSTGLVQDWNSSGYIKDWNSTGYIINWSNVISGGGTPAGSDTEIQFNDGGSFGGAVGLVWDKTLETLSLLSDTIKLYFGASEDVGMWFDGTNFQLKKEVGSNSGVFNISQFEKVKITNTQSSAVLEADAVNSLHNVNSQNEIHASYRLISGSDGWIEKNKGTDLYNTEINNLTKELTWNIDIPDTAYNYSKKPIKLEPGNDKWASFSIIPEYSSDNDNITISLVEGYNFIGYSSDNPISVYDITFTNSTGDEYTYKEAVNNGYIISIRTAQDRTTQGGSHDVTVLTRETAYWFNINIGSGIVNMTLPNVGGSGTTTTFPYTSLMIFNSNTKELKNIANSYTAGWIPSYSIAYWGYDSFARRYTWKTTTSGNLQAWVGYYFQVNIEGLYLILNETIISSGYNVTLNYATSGDSSLNPDSITTKLSGGNFTIEGNGITDSSSYWLCTASDCSSSCQVSIKSGLITGCT